MITMILAAAGPAAGAPASNPYGLVPALKEGGLISQTVFSILVLMSIVSFYILFSKLFEQQKIMNQAKRVRQGFCHRTRCAMARPSSTRTRPTSSSLMTAWRRRSSTSG